MSRQKRPSEAGPYLEKWGLLFEQLGATRMSGRILGWLLICDPPEQTAKEIAAAVGASLASISTATRFLIQLGMIERVGIPGVRSAHLRLRPGIWAQMMRMRLTRIALMGDLAEEGFAHLQRRDASGSRRLREIGSYCRFIEKEFPPLLARWERQWSKERS